MTVEWHVSLSVPVARTTARMGRKSARKSPLQESLLQKRRFGGILVIATHEKIPGFDRYAARLLGGLFISGLQKLRYWWWCGAIRPRNHQACRDSGDPSSRNFRVISDAYAGMKDMGRRGRGESEQL
jgi:hypothetical protein